MRGTPDLPETDPDIPRTVPPARPLPPGRPKGRKNKSTIERERLMQRQAEAEAAARLKVQTIGVRRFTGDSLDFLRSIYQNYKLPLITRLDAAKAALRFERPALSPVEWLPATERPVDDAPAERAPKPAQEPVAADAGDDGGHVVDALAAARAEDRRQRQLETIARFSGARRAAKAIEAALATSSPSPSSNGNGGGPPGADNAGSSGVH